MQEVEREISFRTEQGLYYSYFKALVQSPTLSEGIESLKNDNLTEHTRTINIFQRFNIHQELFLAGLHRLYSFNMKPILFYVEVIFSLQGLYAAMLFLISWSLSGTWISGVLTIFLLVIHRWVSDFQLFLQCFTSKRSQRNCCWTEMVHIWPNESKMYLWSGSLFITKTTTLALLTWGQT